VFAQGDQGRDYIDFPLLGPRMNDLVECRVICRAAVGISGTILFDGANINLLRPEHLRPTHRNRQEMGVAEWHVRDRHVVTYGMRLGHGDVRIC